MTPLATEAQKFTEDVQKRFDVLFHRIASLDIAVSQFGRELGVHHDHHLKIDGRVSAVEKSVADHDRELGELSTSIDNNKEFVAFAHYRLDGLTGAHNTPAATNPVSVPLRKGMLQPGLILLWQGKLGYRMVVCVKDGEYHTVDSDGRWGTSGDSIFEADYWTATDRGPFGTAGVLWHEVAPAGTAVEVGEKL